MQPGLTRGTESKPASRIGRRADLVEKVAHLGVGYAFPVMQPRFALATGPALPHRFRQQAVCARLSGIALALLLAISALADLSRTATLQSGQSLNLDSGAVTSSGDILWTGNSLTPQGSATAYNIGAIGGISGFSKSIVDGLKLVASSTSIPSSALVANDVFAVCTNGGNSAVVLVTANVGGSLTLQFTTFGVAAGPTISGALNNSSEITTGLPNSGIAQEVCQGAWHGIGRRWRCHSPFE